MRRFTVVASVLTLVACDVSTALPEGDLGAAGATPADPIAHYGEGDPYRPKIPAPMQWGSSVWQAPDEPWPVETFPDAEPGTTGSTALGLTGVSVNGTIQPHGGPTRWWFEWGPDTSYGRTTPAKELGGRLEAFYRETFDASVSGWHAGSGSDLKWIASPGGGGFVRYAEPTGDDYNHADGIGIIHLAPYFYPGEFVAETGAALGGGDADLRDARIRASLRGNGWQPNGTELVWWSQIDVWHGKIPEKQDLRYSNWALTGSRLTDALLGGQWENVEFRLSNDTTQWTYAGTNAALEVELNRSVYHYQPLDDVLAHHDTDAFFMLAYVDVSKYPSGTIDLDDFEVAYRNASLVYPSNGSRLWTISSKEDDPKTLTDGWRHGKGHEWKGRATGEPIEIVYDLKDPVVVDRVQLHQSSEWPSKEVHVFVWNGGNTWDEILEGVLPETAPAGPNYAYVLQHDVKMPAKRVKVRISSGYRAEYWGLGEIEVFGSGAKLKTDDAPYGVTADIAPVPPLAPLAAGATYHYRLVTERGGKLVRGGDRTFVAPATAVPVVATGPAFRIESRRARLEGRIDTMGLEADYVFQYGSTTAYGSKTAPVHVGACSTPRTVVGTLSGLTAGRTMHVRIAVTSAAGTAYGEDVTFVAQ
ncbi:MAG: hypothetical protein QM702_21625 [Rubrivivax sp.]